ncbi:lysophospholipid acyltransferase family protein [Rhodomicrobium lacus]|uniref:lysophospholipid acyltransferase family protein n=1 Tax=Rhodomicrobium lacus TaxID=2498452 RepID=UPI000F8CCDE5|nr:lysophospholipid acyltransferase family protein [Rhodomicrobium lacus]
MFLDLRQRLEYGAVLAIAAILRAMPLDVATAFSARAWRFLAPKTHRQARALRNLAKAMPETTRAEREAIVDEMWDNLGRVMAETFLIDRLLNDRSRFAIENPELLEQYRSEMGPLVVAAPHMGNWEIAILPLLSIGANTAGVYRLVENPYVDRYIRNKRAQLYPGGLFASKSNEGLATIMRIATHVRSGGALGMLADLADWGGVQVPFFGHPMYATVAPAWLARRAGTRLAVGRCIRIGKESRFSIAFKELEVPRTGDANEDIKVLTAAIQREFEAWIREHPSQWMWSNKRWPEAAFEGVHH